jgi:hypothetical protein
VNVNPESSPSIENGVLIIPSDCEKEFRWWKGGLKPHLTIEMLGGSQEMIEAYRDPNGTDSDKINNL